MHNHKHTDSHGVERHSHYTTNANKAFSIGIALNIVFVIAEFIIGKLYNSMGLLADAGHNLSDVGGLTISMVAFYLAQKRRTPSFTYGYRKSTILASLFNAIILFGAVGFIVYECIGKFRNPEPVGGVAIMVTAGIGILINGFTMSLFLRDKEHDINLKGAYLHMLADTLVSVGVVFSGVVIYFTGWSVIDPIVGLLIALVIVMSSWSLLVESIRLALDGIPSNVNQDELLKHLSADKNVVEIHHCHIWAISTKENAMTAHVVLKDFSALEKTRYYLRGEAAKHGVHHTTFEFEIMSCQAPACE